MNTVNQSLFHIIIVSGGNKKFLTRVNQDILYNYINSVVYNKYCHPICINGGGDHVHMAIKMSPEVAVSQLVKEIQQNTTDFLRRERSTFPEFSGWDSGYIAISCHPTQQHELEELIKNQFNYHRNASFDDEMEKLVELVKVK